MADLSPSARQVTDVDLTVSPLGSAVLDRQAPFAWAFYRLMALGLNRHTAFLLASHGLGPVAWDAPCPWPDLGRRTA